jgi:hypothetical protein
VVPYFEAHLNAALERRLVLQHMRQAQDMYMGAGILSPAHRTFLVHCPCIQAAPESSSNAIRHRSTGNKSHSANLYSASITPTKLSTNDIQQSLVTCHSLASRRPTGPRSSIQDDIVSVLSRYHARVANGTKLAIDHVQDGVAPAV